MNAATISSTTASSGSVMWTRSASATASAGVAATRAPSFSSARAFASVRFHTVTASPRRSIPSTMALPSRPVPMNATFAITTLPLQSIAVRRLNHNQLRKHPQRPQRTQRKPFSACSARSAVACIVAVVLLGPAEAGHYVRRVYDAYVRGVYDAASLSAAEPPKIFRWAGDPEGGAPFVEADPARPDEVVGFDVEIANLLARGLSRRPAFVNIDFRQIDQSIARGDAEIGMSGIEDTPTRRTTLSVTVPYYDFREVLSVRDADASRLRALAHLRGTA